MFAKYQLTWLSLSLLFSPFATAAEPDDDANEVRIYRSPEERREAGLGTEVTDWLKLSGLVEMEQEWQDDHYTGGLDVESHDEPTAAIQLAAIITFSDWLLAELIYESEYDFETTVQNEKRESGWDEVLLEIDLDDLGIKTGRVYLPFGEYYSHFITGPMLEFGETRGDGLIVDYSLNDNLEIAAFLFDSKVDSTRSSANDIDWGASLELKNESESLIFGLGFLYDLTESDEAFLEEEGNRYDTRASAWSAYLLYGLEQLEFTAEIVQTGGQLDGFDRDRNQPGAWNLEAAWLVTHHLQLAARYEASSEFEDAPERQYGLAATWRPGKHLTLGLEYLRGDYQTGFVTDDDDIAAENLDRFAAQLSVEF
jgi:hypothetical protein